MPKKTLNYCLIRVNSPNKRDTAMKRKLNDFETRFTAQFGIPFWKKLPAGGFEACFSSEEEWTTTDFLIDNETGKMVGVIKPITKKQAKQFCLQVNYRGKE